MKKIKKPSTRRIIRSYILAAIALGTSTSALMSIFFKTGKEPSSAHNGILSLYIFFLILYINFDRVRVLKLYLYKNASEKAKEIALSLTYLRYLKGTNWKLKLTLLVCTGIFFALNWKFPQINLSIIPLVLLGLIGLLIAKELLMEYRIRKGLFGTNRTEAKALIEFIIKNSKNIDFNDSNGNLRRALLPKAEPVTVEHPLPAFGEEASA